MATHTEEAQKLLESLALNDLDIEETTVASPPETLAENSELIKEAMSVPDKGVQKAPSAPDQDPPISPEVKAADNEKNTPPKVKASASKEAEPGANDWLQGGWLAARASQAMNSAKKIVQEASDAESRGKLGEMIGQYAKTSGLDKLGQC